MESFNEEKIKSFVFENQNFELKLDTSVKWDDGSYTTKRKQLYLCLKNYTKNEIDDGVLSPMCFVKGCVYILENGGSDEYFVPITLDCYTKDNHKITSFNVCTQDDHYYFVDSFNLLWLEYLTNKEYSNHLNIQYNLTNE